MNPLCCIAPVSIDRDQADPVAAKNSSGHYQLSLNAAVPVRHVSYSAQVSSAGTESDRASSYAAAHHEVVNDAFCEPRESKVFGGGGIAGILYKWVNYGKGWRSRWFLLEDGVLSYYKVHGPDKILMSPAREKGVTVIGEDSVRYVKKANWNRNRLGIPARRTCKPFGEVHLKVWHFHYQHSLVNHSVIQDQNNTSDNNFLGKDNKF